MSVSGWPQVNSFNAHWCAIPRASWTSRAGVYSPIHHSGVMSPRTTFCFVDLEHKILLKPASLLLSKSLIRIITKVHSLDVNTLSVLGLLGLWMSAYCFNTRQCVVFPVLQAKKLKQKNSSERARKLVRCSFGTEDSMISCPRFPKITSN